jgi:hypothetical protein
MKPEIEMPARLNLLKGQISISFGVMITVRY